jgi:hypothetical protein
MIALVRGVRINYDVVGAAGPWIMLIQGGRQDMELFRPLAEHLAQAGYRVLMHDRRNSGGSDVSLDGEGVIGVERATVADIQLPTCIIPGGDVVHPQHIAEELAENPAARRAPLRAAAGAARGRSRPPAGATGPPAAPCRRVSRLPPETSSGLRRGTPIDFGLHPALRASARKLRLKHLVNRAVLIRVFNLPATVFDTDIGSRPADVPLV